MRIQSVPARTLQNYFRTTANRAVWVRPGAALPRAAPRIEIRGDSGAMGALACDEGQYAERQRARSEEHTSELQSPCNLVCRLLLEKKNPYHADALTWLLLA